MKKFLIAVITMFIIFSLASSSFATLLLRSAFQDAALSIDGFGGTSGNLQTDVPDDSTILAAYLYSSDVWGSGAASINFMGNTLTPSINGTLLTPNVNPVNTWVYDVTTIMAPAIEGTWGLQNHSIVENGYLDGEVLVVVYSNASTVGNTAIIMDGELSTGGDTTTLTFSEPYAGGDLLMSLAISYSYGDGQYTEVDVTTDSTDNRRLTSAAGGNDDGGFVAADGSLMTVGGVGDDPSNPANPFLRGDTYDDELYNLALGNEFDPNPFINVGDTFLRLNTRNPSNDDNVFGLFLSSTFSISQVDDDIIDDDPPVQVPEPSTWLLLGTGLVGLASYRRKRIK